MHSFAGLIRRTPPPTFSDTAITDRHSDTTNFQLRAHWVRISWSIGSEKSFGHVPPVGVEPSTSCMQGEHPIHRTESECYNYIYQFNKGSLADLIGRFLNTVLWKKFSMKRNICPAGTSHTYVRKMNILLFSNLWYVKAVNC